jgi:hypothetical protein
VPVLFAHGADFRVKDNRGKTPIQISRTWEIVVTLIAVGIDCSVRRDFQNFRGCFLAAVGHPGVAAGSGFREEQLARACGEVAERQFDLLRLRAFQVCVDLQTLRFPAVGFMRESCVRDFAARVGRWLHFIACGRL